MSTSDDMLDTLVLQARDPAVAAWCRAIGNELDRVQAAAEAVAADLVPLLATDDRGLLAVHEAERGLLPEPALAEAQRQSLLRARLLSRSVGPRTDWAAAVQAALGDGVPFEVRVDGSTVEVLIPSSITGLRREAFERELRAITNAGVRISIGYTEGFIVGVSQVGDVI